MADITKLEEIGIVVSLIVVAGISGAAGYTMAQQTPAPQQSQQTTETPETVDAQIQDVIVEKREYVVTTNSDRIEYIGVVDNSSSGSSPYIHFRRVPEGASAAIFPLNYSRSAMWHCGYRVDGPTEMVVLDEDYNTLDRLEYNITAETDVCETADEPILRR